jgi:glycosyltransferase involved in cell wall biosynthesis
MAAARCCVTSDCCGQRDLIEHRENGLLFPAGNAASLAEQIETCLADGLTRRRLGANAQRSVRDRAWPSVASEVAECVLGI